MIDCDRVVNIDGDWVFGGFERWFEKSYSENEG